MLRLELGEDNRVDGYFPVGLGLIGLSVLMFLIALPRRGEVVGFLRRDGAQAAYMMALILILCIGITVSLAHAA
jgi:hypothetical protein